MAELDKILAHYDVLERLYRLGDDVPLTTSEAAIFLRSSVSALEKMRVRGSGPTYIQDLTASAGVNQKCLYRKSALLAWQNSNEVNSTVRAAIAKGQLFLSVFDLAREEAFWIDGNGDIIGMVESTRMDVVLARLGVVEVTWMPVLDAATSRWVSLSKHRAVANLVSEALQRAMQRVAAGMDATDIGESSRQSKSSGRSLGIDGVTDQPRTDAP